MPAWGAPLSDHLDFQDCVARAAECEEEAKRAEDEEARRVYRQLADHWRLLADIARRSGEQREQTLTSLRSVPTFPRTSRGRPDC